MDIEDIKENLCYYESNKEEILKNNELTEKELQLKIQDSFKGNCYCDNCFYGRTKLAREIIKLLSEQHARQ